MKTIAFNRQGSLFRGLFVLAALGGLYYFRRQGGSVGQLWTAGRQGLDQARGLINRVAPSTSMGTSMSSSGSQGTQSVSAGAQI